MNPTLGACFLVAVSATPAELPISDEDLNVFPPYEFVVYATELSRNFMYQADCERDRYYLDPQEQQYKHMRYLDQYNRWFVWDDVKLAYQYKDSARLNVLRRLRDRLGEDAYYRGVLPNCISPYFGN